MKFAVVENGIVTNMVIADAALEANWVQTDEAGIGWLYDGATFSAPPEKPAPVPASMSFAQLLIGLVAEAWITEAEGEAWLVGTLPAPLLALINSLPASEQFAAKARAIRPSEVLRSNALVVALGAATGKTEAQIDTFFRTYAQV